MTEVRFRSDSVAHEQMAACTSRGGEGEACRQNRAQAMTTSHLGCPPLQGPLFHISTQITVVLWSDAAQTQTAQVM